MLLSILPYVSFLFFKPQLKLKKKKKIVLNFLNMSSFLAIPRSLEAILGELLIYSNLINTY